MSFYDLKVFTIFLYIPGKKLWYLNDSGYRGTEDCVLSIHRGLWVYRGKSWVSWGKK